VVVGLTVVNVTNGAKPHPPSPGPLTPGEALAALFLDNADRGANAANDALVGALRQRARDIQALAADHPC
jgi:hypothetical protein